MSRLLLTYLIDLTCPLIPAGAPIPHWWQGIAYRPYEQHIWRCAPIPVNHLVGLLVFLYGLLRSPWKLKSFLRADDLGRLAFLDKRVYLLLLERGDLKLQLREEREARQRLEFILNTTISDNLDEVNCRRNTK